MPRMISFEYLMKLISESYVFHLMTNREEVQKSEVAKFYGLRITSAANPSTCRELF